MSLTAPSRSFDFYTETIRREFGDEARATSTIERLLLATEYEQVFCNELFVIARDSAASWKLRFLAVLALENQILKLSPSNEEEHARLFEHLGIHIDRSTETLTADLVKQGYSNSGFERFVAEFRGRLVRLDRLHQKLTGLKTSLSGLADFINIAATECKLTLARFIFQPVEVADRITRQLYSSTGMTDVAALDQPLVRNEINHCMSRLPRFEAELIRLLSDRSRIHWVSKITSSEINSLVEYPINTVVLVIKPPGSSIEFEIKRAGLRAERPLKAIYYEDGLEAPPTHRLFGGSMAYYLRWEAGTAADLSKVYRLIHHKEPPISKTLSVSTIYTIPINGNEQHVMKYFSDMESTGDPDDTRTSMRYSIEAFEHETRIATPYLAGDFGLATQFLSHVVPSQSILTGTTSFRLDRVADYLSSLGPKIYFIDGLRRDFTTDDARGLADQLLEEVLGSFTPPDSSCDDYSRYIAAAFDVRSNRAIADKTYISMLKQIGEFWGTLLGMRSYSYGESFVARNVGIKSVFENGEWTARLIFLDHDVTYLTGRRSRDFHPLSAIPGMSADDRHVWGYTHARGEVQLLREIYKVDSRLEVDGHAALRDSMTKAYRKTQDEICENENVRGFFHPPFRDRIKDWDEVSIPYLEIKDRPLEVIAWKEESSRRLLEKGYSEGLVSEYLRAIERHHGFIRKYSFLCQLK